MALSLKITKFVLAHIKRKRSFSQFLKILKKINIKKTCQSHNGFYSAVV